MIPTDLAMALAVMGWSPVTMMTLIPADLHLSTASGTAVLGEVGLIGVERVSSGVLVSGQHEVTEAEYSLSKSSQLHVGSLESVLPFVIEGVLLAFYNNGGAPFKDPLWSTLHDKEVSGVAVLGLVDGNLVLVGRVEGDLAD